MRIHAVFCPPEIALRCGRPRESTHPEGAIRVAIEEIHGPPLHEKTRYRYENVAFVGRIPASRGSHFRVPGKSGCVVVLHVSDDQGERAGLRGNRVRRLQVARRTLSVVVFPLMCGTGISIPRYLACAEGRKKDVGEWLVAGASLGAGLQTVFLILAGLLATQLGRFTFGPSSTNPLIASLLVATAGPFTHSLGYAALRGLSRFQYANALQVAKPWGYAVGGRVAGPRPGQQRAVPYGIPADMDRILSIMPQPTSTRHPAWPRISQWNRLAGFLRPPAKPQ